MVKKNLFKITIMMMNKLNENKKNKKKQFCHQKRNTTKKKSRRLKSSQSIYEKWIFFIASIVSISFQQKKKINGKFETMLFANLNSNLVTVFFSFHNQLVGIFFSFCFMPKKININV